MRYQERCIQAAEKRAWRLEERVNQLEVELASRNAGTLHIINWTRFSHDQLYCIAYGDERAQKPAYNGELKENKQHFLEC
jgi:hypothetical protein